MDGESVGGDTAEAVVSCAVAAIADTLGAMPSSQNDHYVSQTYLSHFADANGLLIPYFKDGRIIIGKPKRPKSICSEQDGDSNTYFEDHRLLDTYLRPIETAWSTNVKSLSARTLSPKQKFGIASYVAYLRSCNPVAKRLSQERLAQSLQPIRDKVLSEGLYTEPQSFPPLDDATRASLQKAFESGEIQTIVDREYAHATGIAVILDCARRLYCSHWLMLRNETNIPFLTSDNPAVLYPHGDTDPSCSVFVPLSPSDALLISPNEELPRPTEDDALRYDNATDRFATVKPEAAHRFNELIVKSAERLVLHASAERWIELLVSQYRSWRVKNVCDSIPLNRGVVQIHRQRPVEVPPET